MNQGKYVFAQVACFLPVRIFDRCVKQYDGNKGVRHFTCWNQMMCMMFGQLSARDSLRDLITTLNAIIIFMKVLRMNLLLLPGGKP